MYEVDARSGEIRPRFEWDEIRTALSSSGDGRVLVQDSQSYNSVGELIVYHADTGETLLRTDHNRDALADSAVDWELVRTVELPHVEGWLLSPSGLDRTARHPLVVHIHGGPEDAFGHNLNLTQRALVSHGFLVLCPNPRGSTGYGRAFADAVLLDWGPGPLSDVIRLLDVVCARDYVDAGRVGIMGESYGGYLSAFAIGHTDRFSAAVCVSVTFDLTSQYLGADNDFLYGDIAWGGPPQLNADWYSTNSPSKSANRVTTPTLILHGLADQRCPVGQAEEMFVALKKFGVQTELILYPGESHGLEEARNPAYLRHYLGRIVDWFTRHLGDGRVARARR